MELSHKEFVSSYKRKQKKNRMWLGLAIAALVLVFLLSLCFRTVFPGFIPKYAAVNIWTYIKLTWSRIWGTDYYLNHTEIEMGLECYTESVLRLFNSIFTVLSGMALGLAGAVYQQIYKNPIASPSTIGATAGVSFGNMIMAIIYSYSAVTLVVDRYLWCMGATFAITIIVVLLGRFMGYRTGSFSVVEMLMLGSIIARMVTAFNTFMMYHLSTGAMIAYQQLNLGVYQSFTYKNLLIFFVLILIGLIPLLKMRFRLNALSMDPMEAKASGIKLFGEQLLAQFLAAILVGAACIQCGDVGLFALVIPHFVRYVIGNDFRKLAIYSTVFGGIFLLIMRIISSLIFLGTDPMPINFIVSIVMIPVFMIILALHRRGFD